MSVVASQIESAGPAKPLARDRSESDSMSDEDSAFAGLLVMAQAGLGRRANEAAATLHHESVPLGTDDGDARQDRLADMKDQAEAGGSSGRSSRLDPQGRGGDGAVGPHGQRLALEKQEAAQGRGAERGPTDGDVSKPPVNARGAEDHPRATAGRVANAGEATQAVPATRSSGAPPEADVTPRPTELPPQDRGQEAKVSPRSSSNSPLLGANASASPTGLEMAVPAVRTEPLARQVAELLTGTGRGVQATRAPGSVEQPGAVRAVESATEPAVGRQTGREVMARRSAGQSDTARQGEATRESRFERLVQSIRMQFGPKQSTMRLRLDPPELGWMRIEAKVEGPRVQLFVQTETAAAGELLRERIADLRAALEQHGLRIDRFELSPPGETERQEQPPAQSEPNQERSSQSSPQRESGGEHRAGQQSDSSESGTSPVADGDGEEESGITTAVLEMRLDVQA